MKKTLSLLAAILMLNVISFAQNNINLVVFAEDGDAFYVFVNGVKQNQKPESNVKITGISPNVSLRIEFENKALPQLKQNMSLEPGFEHTARIKRDKNQQVKLRYFGQVPIDQAPADKGVATVGYHTADNGSNAGGGNADQNNSSNISISSTTTTTKVSSGNGNTENATINVSMPGVGITMNVNDPGMNTSMQSSSSSTVTTTTSGGYQDDNVSTTTKTVKAPVQAEGCATPMDGASFSKMKQSVESKPFSDTKMSTAKVATKNSCLSVNQVKEIAKLFSMDEDKLAYAKYAYDYCVDKNNYYQVGDIFSFSTTTDELNAFLAK